MKASSGLVIPLRGFCIIDGDYTLDISISFTNHYGGALMETTKTKRKLTAILSADVKGYSRLMGDDEAATVATLKKYRDIISSLVEKNSGRVVDSPGDNLLAECGSVVDAVECAVTVQKTLRDENATLPEDRRMEFRIGINLGDVIDDAGRIYGDGVNVAARVEGLAEGGGICISGTAFDQIGKKLALGYEFLGEQTVKNIEKPIRVYKVLMEPEAAGKVIGEGRPKPKNLRWASIGAVAILIIVAGVFAIWNFYLRPDVEPASVERMAYPLPDKPSIAVLAFDNLSNDPSQEYFCDGITEEIITGLSKLTELFVIARNSSFTYKGKAVKVQQVAQDLGVRYVLEGSVRKSQEKLRVTAQLIDAVKGHHLWADRWDRELKDIFAIQDEITMKIITSLQVELTRGEQARVVAKGSSNLDAYLKVLEANEKVALFNQENNALARRLAQEAVELDPDYAFAYMILGKTHMLDVWLGTTPSPKKSIGQAIKLAQKALSIDESLGRARGLLGFLYTMAGKSEIGIIEAEKAITLEPNSDLAHQYLGLALRFGGRPNDAIPVIKKAIRLNPSAPGTYLFNLGLSYLFSGQHEEAIAECERATSREPNNLGAHIALTVAYGLSGRDVEARAAALEVLRINPKFSLAYYAKSLVYKNRADKNRYIDALRKAGLPETPPLPLPDKPSIAVLPFDNMSDDPKQEYFSDGISTEIINALVRWPAIVVIPKSSSFIYKGKTVDAKQVGRELGVRYVLEGSVRREGNRVRVTVQLIDITTLKHLFSERYEREMKDIFAIQDEITIKALTAMRVSLSGEGVQPLRGKGTKSIDAYLKVLQAEAVFQAVNRDTQARARLLAEEAIAFDPEYARAYAMVAATIGNEVLLGVYENRREALQRAMAMAEKAIQLDDFEEATHRLLGFLAMLNKDYEKALAETKRAVELAPNSVMAQIVLAYVLYSAGRTEEAIPILEKAASSSPIILPRALSHLGVALRKAGRLEEAVAVCTKLIKIKPNYIFPHLTLAAAFAEMGKMEEARAEVKEVLRIRPKYTVKLVPSSFPWKDKDELDRLADFLRKAGLPE